MLYVKLEISHSSYEEIKERIFKAGAYELVNGDGSIYMDGIALIRERKQIPPRPDPSVPFKKG